MWHRSHPFYRNSTVESCRDWFYFDLSWFYQICFGILFFFLSPSSYQNLFLFLFTAQTHIHYSGFLVYLIFLLVQNFEIQEQRGSNCSSILIDSQKRMHSKGIHFLKLGSLAANYEAALFISILNENNSLDV